ncbi:uncharacterized protein TNIN_5301 [Trichonephila inaurata madagascariensis]|uniref:DNA-directed DNA polymerase n=1 Tax=Trichonephila inaurata madagascariensis TaxID=2747483 RepID=A0A8X6YUN0_9ARAC|nr:uncharacterized protein TNIN_5301 [Trichonephila inaurata madagascariensis]
MKGIKWYVCVKVRFVRKTAETEEEKCESHFRSICEITLLNESPEKKVTAAFLKILSSCEEFEGRGSGWILDEILHLEVKTCAYQPLAASSYIPLPKIIAKKKAVINIKNSNDKCFLWCVLAALHPVNVHAERINNYLSFEKEINCKDEENFKSSTLCSICENPLNGDAVRDHDHLTGAYRGAAHNSCNLNFKLANSIPVVIHNLRNYDGHFLIQGIAFFNSLTNENASREDYKYAHQIWNISQMHTFGDYHDLYVTVDVLLLSDIFENFRTLCQNYYKIDPCHTYTAPGLAWQAYLKMTKVRLELLTDIDMHLFIEKGIRGGVAMISHRYAKANNVYLSTYD